MNTIIKKIYLLPLAISTLLLSGCMDNVEPTSFATKEQINSSSTSFDMLVNGLKSKMMELRTYGSTAGSAAEATGDWGYPCFMLWRDVTLDGMPSTGTSWNYQYTLEAATNLSYYSVYPYYYYYSFINNTNRILNGVDEVNASESVKQSLARVHTYRALCYMQLSSMFEFYKTGIEELDSTASKVLGLTVPILTENTTADESKNNPRAPFYKMYRFIYKDLAFAEDNINRYSRSEKNDINADVINGLMARFWLNLGTRFERNPNDLVTQLEHEGDQDGFKDLGITSALDCYRKAGEYAQQVIYAGYTPMTSEQWHDATTGFNTANTAWVWSIKFSSTEQTAYSWCSITGLFASEPTWAMPAYGSEYRCISKALYDQIGDGDWRKTTWVDPEDAGAVVAPTVKYNTVLKDSTAATKAAKTAWCRLPAYANLKFRSGSGNMESEEVGLLVDIPLMRVEEMYFIDMEAKLHTAGLAQAKQALESFLNTYRYTDGKQYVSAAATDREFIYEMIGQKYIEFWGEDVLFADYKRLGLKVDRTQDDTNYLSSYQMHSYEGYAAPWMNFYIPSMERDFNKGIVMNPDPVSYIAKYCK